MSADGAAGAHPQEWDDYRRVAWWGIAAGVLSSLVAMISVPPPPQTPAALVQLFAERSQLVATSATIVAAWSVFSLPFAIASATLLDRSGTALAAGILSALGISLVGFARFAFLGAMLSIVAAGRSHDGVDLGYQAAVLENLSFYLTDPGLMTWGLGQLLVARLAWRRRLVPRWIAAFGMASGIAGLLTLAVYKMGMLALLQVVAFAVWALATSMSLLRSRRAARVTGA